MYKQKRKKNTETHKYEHTHPYNKYFFFQKSHIKPHTTVHTILHTVITINSAVFFFFLFFFFRKARETDSQNVRLHLKVKLPETVQMVYALMCIKRRGQFRRVQIYVREESIVCISSLVTCFLFLSFSCVIFWFVFRVLVVSSFFYGFICFSFFLAI